MLRMVLTVPMLLIAACPAWTREESPFVHRGCYITLMRMPTYDLTDWKKIVDGIHDDGGNTLLLWVGGALRSLKYPITSAYNKDHENVRHDFVRDLIDHAHAREIKVLLSFTPFAYDGVNQYALEHPETRGSDSSGEKTKELPDDRCSESLSQTMDFEKPRGIGADGAKPQHAASRNRILASLRLG